MKDCAEAEVASASARKRRLKNFGEIGRKADARKVNMRMLLREIGAGADVRGEEVKLRGSIGLAEWGVKRGARGGQEKQIPRDETARNDK